MKGLLILLAVCVMAIAMVPLERRAVNTEEEEERLRSERTTLKPEETKICAETTPCAWSIYKPLSKRIEMSITNTYCECDGGMSCQYFQDDVAINAYEYRCKPLVKEDAGES